MSVLNKGINYGHSSKLNYDNCAYEDKLRQSTKPLEYRLNSNQIDNCDACLSTLGPRSSRNGHGVSTINQRKQAPSQDLVDLESILSNRNLIASKCNNSNVNDVDVTRFKLNHSRICNDFLNPVATHLTDPAQNYREMSINRFYDLPNPAQFNIYESHQINTQLEAKDNYCEKMQYPLKKDNSLPQENKMQNQQCTYKCYSDC